MADGSVTGGSGMPTGTLAGILAGDPAAAFTVDVELSVFGMLGVASPTGSVACFKMLDILVRRKENRRGG